MPSVRRRSLSKKRGLEIGSGKAFRDRSHSFDNLPYNKVNQTPVRHIKLTRSRSAIGRGDMSLGFKDKHLLIGKVEEYNRKIQLPTFHIKGNFTDQDEIEYEGALRFFLTHGENNFTKAVRLTSSTTWKDLKPQLYEKFNLLEGVASGTLVPILYVCHGTGETGVRDEDRPLVMALNQGASIQFNIRVYTKGDDSNEPSPPPNHSQNFFSAMKKKLKKGNSKQSIQSISPKTTPTMNRHSALSRDPVQPLAHNHSRQASNSSSLSGKLKPNAVSRKQSDESQTNNLGMSAAAGARSMENLAKGGKTKKKGRAPEAGNMAAIDDLNEHVTIHGERSELGVDEVVIPIDPSMTVRDIITDVLEECGISLALVDDYTVADVIGRNEQGMWLTDYSRDMNESEKPLVLISMVKPSEGLSRRFEIRHIRKDEDADTLSRTTESNYNDQFIPQPLKRQTSTSLSSISNATDNYNTQTLKFPTDGPYFLTVQSFDPQHDQVIHLIQGEQNIIGSSEDDENCNIRLFASDIQPQHCMVTKESQDDGASLTVDIAPFPGAQVLINDEKVTHKTQLKPGDVVAVGDHYIFIFKDPLNRRAQHTSSSTLARHTSVDGNQASLNYESQRSTWQEVMNRVMRLHFSLDRQDELINKIMTVMEPDKEGFPLTPAYLIALALDNSKHLMRGDQLASFINKIASHVQSAVWESCKLLQADGRECESTNPVACLDILRTNLRVVLFWMANCIELRSHFVELYHDLLVATGRTDSDSIDNAVNEVIMVLSDAITYAFQQAVYHLTKVLYPTLDLIVLDNPFSKPSMDTVSMSDTITALTQIHTLCINMSLNRNITHQLFTYLYFFIGTSLCNKMFENDSVTLYYKWEEGVKIRKNLETLENWAVEFQMETANHYLSKVIAVADFLATSKQFLLQATWTQLRTVYSILSAAQIRHLLDNYDLGSKPVPTQWSCPEEEVGEIMEAGVMESFDNHPPLIMPKESTIDITVKLEDDFFQSKLEYLNSFFNPQTSEDETDSGFDFSHSRSPTEIEDPSSKFPTEQKLENRNSTSSSTNKSYTPIFKKKKDMVQKQSAYSRTDTTSSSDESEIQEQMAGIEISPSKLV